MRALFSINDEEGISAMAVYIASISRDMTRIREAMHVIDMIGDDPSTVEARAGVMFSAFAHAYHGACGSPTIDDKHGLRQDIVDCHHASMFYEKYGFKGEKS